MPRNYRGENPLLIGVLRGAVVVMSDLMRNIDLQCELDFMDISSYSVAPHPSGVVRILKDLEEDITDRHVLIVEDIETRGCALVLEAFPARPRARLARDLRSSLQAFQAAHGPRREVSRLRGTAGRVRRRIRARLRRGLPQPP